jgi:GxxExxY protein
MKRIAPSSFDPRDPRTYQIIGSAMAVHRELGSGFLEPVYQEALSIEFTARGIPSCREWEIPVHYKGIRLGAAYRADFLCFGEVLVELKALDRITPREQAQVIHYLKALNLKTGLLINFGSRVLEFNRLLNPALYVTTGAVSV